MSANEFLLLYAVLLTTMLASRCLPLLLLRGRTLSPRVERALSLIPAAAFSALVANDLLDPTLFAKSPVDAAMTIVAAALVVVVGRRTGSLIWCALVGLAAYWLLVIAW